MSKGVTCFRCGASTPLPDDLRVATFRCAYCQGELQTVAYVGQETVTADALNAFANDELHGKIGLDAIASAPQYRKTNDHTESRPCKRCGAMLTVPFDLYVNDIECPGCHVTQPVTDYVSQAARVEFDMQRQLAGNRALAQLRSEGVACHQCAAKNPVPDEGSPQVKCAFCGAVILLSDHVPQDAIARSRLKQGMMARRAEAERMQADAQRRGRVVAMVVLGVVAVFVIAGVAAGALH